MQAFGCHTSTPEPHVILHPTRAETMHSCAIRVSVDIFVLRNLFGSEGLLLCSALLVGQVNEVRGGTVRVLGK